MVSACAQSFTPASSIPTAVHGILYPQQQPPKRIPFAQVTRPFISDPRINLREFRVYTALLTFPTNDAGERWPSRETLGKMTGLPPKVVSRTTSRLQDLGWLVKSGDGGRSHTARYIVFDQAQPPGVILNYHTANRTQTPTQAQADLPIPPQVAPVAPVNPPQNEPGLPPKGGQNGEGQVVDYLNAEDKKEPTTEPDRHEPAAAGVPPLSDCATQPPQTPEPAPQPQPIPKAPRLTKTAVPESIPDVWLEQAGIQRPDLTAETIRKSAGIFIDRHTAKGTLLVDWSAAFRVWIARERAPKTAVQAPQAPQAPKAVNPYAHLDAKEQPVSAAVRSALAAMDQRFQSLCAANGIDPKTGQKIVQPAAPTPTPAPTPAPAIPMPTIGGACADASYQARWQRLLDIEAARNAAKDAIAGD